MRYFFLVIIFHVFIFSLLLIFFPEKYDYISREDHLIENLTALFLLVASVLLFLAALKSQKNSAKKVLLFVVALVFFWGAGEEISWGQRIFDIATPEKLKEINDQDELNLHNIDKKFFDRLVDLSNIALVFIATLMLLLKVKSILKIPLSHPLLIVAFALVPFYRQYNVEALDFYHLLYLPLLILLFYAIKQKDKILAGSSASVLLISVALYFLQIHFQDHFEIHNNSANEFREYLFALCSAAYAFQIKGFSENG